MTAGMKPKTQKHQQEIADRFNRAYPVGTRVYLRKDAGDEVLTRVTHPAEVRPGPVAIAWFEGVSGYYAVEGRVRLMTE